MPALPRPNTSSPNLPCLAASYQASPAIPHSTLPCTAVTYHNLPAVPNQILSRHNSTQLAMPATPYLATPNLNGTHLTVTHHDRPRPTLPCLPYRTLPCCTLPHQAMTDLACRTVPYPTPHHHTPPQLTLHRLACLTLRQLHGNFRSVRPSLLSTHQHRKHNRLH